MTKLTLGAVALAIVAAPQTIQPGQMTQARVWVQNRGRSEAIPIDLRDANLDAPLKVHVVNGESGGSPLLPLVVRPVRPTWEYEMVTVNVPPGNEMAAILSGHGAAGWETTGLMFATPDGTAVLMKRPR